MFEGRAQASKADTAEVSCIYGESYQLDSVAEQAIGAADAIAGALVRTFAPRHACDVGCGGGALVRALEQRGVDAVGVEGSVFGSSLYPDRIQLHDLRSPLYPKQHYELVTCFDVAEHIEEEYSEVFLRNLVGLTAPWGWLVLGPAGEGQDGLGHVNCQHPTYWIEKLQGFGFGLFPQLSNRLRAEIRTDPR